MSDFSSSNLTGAAATAYVIVELGKVLCEKMLGPRHARQMGEAHAASLLAEGKTKAALRIVDAETDSLVNLESLGLLRFSDLSGFSKRGLPLNLFIHYGGKSMTITPDGSDHSLDVGQVLLTRSGEEMASLLKCEPVAGFYEYLLERWARYLQPIITKSL